jgi:hypothetical protein
MAYDAARREVVRFGGSANGTTSGTLGDTWTWNGTTWTQKLPAASPSPRSNPGLAYDTFRGVVVLFGGANTGYLSDTWEWNGTT